MFAAIGMDSILKGKPRLGPGKLKAAANVQLEIRRSLLRFVASDEFDPAADLPDVDYGKLLPLVSAKKLPPPLVDAVFAVVPDKELAAEVCEHADRVLTWANGVLPRGDADPVTGEVDDPPTGAIYDFRRVWQVACNPMAIVVDLGDGSLYDDQVQAAALLSPAHFKAMQETVPEVIGTMVSRRGKGWKLNPTKRAYLDTLKQQSDFDPDLASLMAQQSAFEEAQQPPPPAKSRSGSAPEASSQESTPGQQAAASPNAQK